MGIFSKSSQSVKLLQVFKHEILEKNGLAVNFLRFRESVNPKCTLEP